MYTHGHLAGVHGAGGVSVDHFDRVLEWHHVTSICDLGNRWNRASTNGQGAHRNPRFMLGVFGFDMATFIVVGFSGAWQSLLL